MTDPTLFSDAAAQVTWLAAQPRQLWRSRRDRREAVGIVCQTSREARLTVDRVIHDIAPDLPRVFVLADAADALAWCNSVGRLGHRATVALSMLDGDDAGQLHNDFVLIRELSTELREQMGGNPDLLTGDQMRLVEDNMALVRWAVGRWGATLRDGDHEYDAEDAYQEATLGLMRAARKFDPSKGFTFATYAYAHLQAAIIGGEAKSRGTNYRRHKRKRTRYVPPILFSELASLNPGGATALSKRRPGMDYGLRELSTDDDLDSAEWSTHAHLIVEARDRVCTNDTDLAIVDALCADSTGLSLVGVMRQLGKELDMSPEYLKHRWYDEIRPKLVVELEHLRAS